MCYISFCISSYERRDMLIELVEHLLSCDSQAIEVAVMDDCSNDGTEEALAAISDKRLRYRRNCVNRGAALCWYDALEFGQGKWLFQLMDRDWIDIGLIDKLIVTLHAFEQNGVGFAAAGERTDGAGDYRIYTKGLEAQKEFALRDSHPTGQIFRRDCLREINGREQYFANQEYGIYPHGYLYAILGNCYAGAQIHFDICSKRTYRQRYAKTVSRVYEIRNDKQPWFYPEKGLQFLKLACGHMELIEGEEERRQVAAHRYIRFSRFPTKLYYNACVDDVIKHRYHCENLSTDYTKLLHNLFTYIHEARKYLEDCDFSWKNESFYNMLYLADKEILDEMLPWIESVRIKDAFRFSDDGKRVDSQTWEAFKQFSAHKKIFVFGVGKQLEVLCDTRLKEYVIEGILDNDMHKCGMKVSEYCSYTEEVTFVNDVIMRPEELANYDEKDTVILITSKNFYVEIINQLRELGYGNYYAAAAMTAKEPDAINWEKYTRDYYIRECCNYPVCGRKIIFYAMGRYSGHGKAITEALLSTGEDVDIVWIVTKEHLKTNVPEKVRLVCTSNRRKLVYEMETAKCWLYEHPVPRDYVKRPEQYYIQLKHWSSVTLKTFGRMLHEFRNEPEGVEHWRYNGKIMDYVFVGSDFDEETCRRGFCFDKEVVRVGSPRSDVLFRGHTVKDKIFQLYQIGLDAKILLYAPTFRFEEGAGACRNVLEITQIDFYRLKAALEKRFGGNWIILLRFHPLNHSADGNTELPPFVTDVTDYNDGEELAAVSDILITDYSSIMFELAFVRRPVFLYAPDRKEYIDGERELLIDYNSLPFDIAENNGELCEAIDAFDAEGYCSRVDSFMKQYGVCEDGHASERAAKFLIDLLK